MCNYDTERREGGCPTFPLLTQIWSKLNHTLKHLSLQQDYQSRADTDPNLSTSDTCLNLGGIWTVEHGTVAIQERSHNTFSHCLFRWHCVFLQERSEAAWETQQKKYREKTSFLRRISQSLLLDLGTILMWSLSYAFPVISKKLLWYGVKALGRGAAKTC